MTTSYCGQGRALAIVLGWNLPWALFTVYALIVLVWSGPAGWSCPIDHALGVCPGCGLTRAYADLLGGQAPGTWWIVPVLIGFVLNAGWSLVRLTRITRPPVRIAQTGVSHPA